MVRLIKGAIIKWLRNGHWKGFLEESEQSKDTILLDMDVVTIQQESEKIYFDASIIYFSKEEGQKQIVESGVVTISKEGTIKKVSIKKRDAT